MAGVDISEQINGLGGIATSSELKSAGFSAGAIAYALETGSIDRLTRGCTALRMFSRMISR